jgi:glycosyltransferase involved in cell wall biosynthesis
MEADQAVPGLLGISFDAVPLSGVVIEFLKVARIFRNSGYRIHLDLGYEIKSDKGQFFAQHDDALPDWVNPIRILQEPFDQYANALVAGTLSYMAQPLAAEPDQEELMARYAREIATRLVRTFEALNLRILIVENGTLPENVMVAEALRQAIEVYGRRIKAGKYVLWRDHDLMWTSESSSRKYGRFPYPRVPKLKASPFITNVVLSAADRDLAKAWSPEAELEIFPNHFWNRMASDPARTEAASGRAFRTAHGIPEGAILIARYTRIIPQKRIDRDLDLLSFLHQLAREHQEDPGPYLCIAGDEKEAAEESRRLRERVRSLQLEAFVVFTGELEPMCEACATGNGRSTYDLIAASDLCSFLTSQDYESFGNPIAEAIMLHRPYLASSYHRYRHCYADKGYRGLVFPVAEGNDGPMDLGFASTVYRFLKDRQARTQLVAHNDAIWAREHPPEDELAERLGRLFSLPLSRG